MNRRQFLGSAALGAGVAVVGCGPAPGAAESPRRRPFAIQADARAIVPSRPTSARRASRRRSSWANRDRRCLHGGTVSPSTSPISVGVRASARSLVIPPRARSPTSARSSEDRARADCPAVKSARGKRRESLRAHRRPRARPRRDASPHRHGGTRAVLHRRWRPQGGARLRDCRCDAGHRRMPHLQVEGGDRADAARQRRDDRRVSGGFRHNGRGNVTDRTVVEHLGGVSRARVQRPASVRSAVVGAPHGSITPQKNQEGDVVMVDGGTSCEGYASDITRTRVFGRPTLRGSTSGTRRRSRAPPSPP